MLFQGAKFSKGKLSEKIFLERAVFMDKVLLAMFSIKKTF